MRADKAHTSAQVNKSIEWISAWGGSHMFRFSFGRRMEVQAVPALLSLPPRGGALIAEVRADRIETLAAALVDGAALEVGRLRAVRVAVGMFVVETGHGSMFVQDAVEAVKRLLEFDSHQALAA